MAYLDMAGMEDMEANEIVDLANPQPSVVSPEIVNMDDVSQPIIPTEIVNLGAGMRMPQRAPISYQPVRGGLLPQRGRIGYPGSGEIVDMRGLGQTQHQRRRAAPNIVQGLGAAAAAARAGRLDAHRLRAGTMTMAAMPGRAAGALLMYDVPVREKLGGGYVTLRATEVKTVIPAGTEIRPMGGTGAAGR